MKAVVIALTLASALGYTAPALRPRASRDATGRMHTLRQGRFLLSGWDLDSAGLAEQALLYVPQACAGGGSCAVQ